VGEWLARARGRSSILGQMWRNRWEENEGNHEDYETKVDHRRHLEYTKEDAAEDYFPKEIPGKEKLIKDELDGGKSISVRLRRN
jgi:hypothetical protein